MKTYLIVMVTIALLVFVIFDRRTTRQRFELLEKKLHAPAKESVAPGFTPARIELGRSPRARPNGDDGSKPKRTSETDRDDGEPSDADEVTRERELARALGGMPELAVQGGGRARQ